MLMARARGRPLQWLKTDHAFPIAAALLDTQAQVGRDSGELGLPDLRAA